MENQVIDIYQLTLSESLQHSRSEIQAVTPESTFGGITLFENMFILITFFSIIIPSFLYH